MKMPKYTKYAVNIDAWVDGSGWSYSQTYDWLTEKCTAEEYIKSLRSEGCPFEIEEGEDLLVSIVGYVGDPMFEDGVKLSECWVSDMDCD